MFKRWGRHITEWVLLPLQGWSRSTNVKWCILQQQLVSLICYLYCSEKNLTSSSSKWWHYSKEMIMSCLCDLKTLFMGTEKAFNKLVLSCFESWQLNSECRWFSAHFYQVWNKCNEGRWEKKKPNQQCTLTETCISCQNCAVEAVFINHTVCIIVGERGNLKYFVSFSSTVFYFSWILCAAKSNYWSWFPCIVFFALKFKE